MNSCVGDICNSRLLHAQVPDARACEQYDHHPFQNQRARQPPSSSLTITDRSRNELREMRGSEGESAIPIDMASWSPAACRIANHSAKTQIEPQVLSRQIAVEHGDVAERLRDCYLIARIILSHELGAATRLGRTARSLCPVRSPPRQSRPRHMAMGSCANSSAADRALGCDVIGFGRRPSPRISRVLHCDLATRWRAGDRTVRKLPHRGGGQRKGFRQPRRLQRRQALRAGCTGPPCTRGRRDRGPPFLRAPWCRSARVAARRVSEYRSRQRARGRQHDHAATRSHDVSFAGTHRQAQSPGGDACAVARASALEGGNPHPLSEHRLFRSKRLRRGRRGEALLRQVRQGCLARRSGHAGGTRALPLDPRSPSKSRRSASASRYRARRHDRNRRRPTRAGRRRASTADDAAGAARNPAGHQLLRRHAQQRCEAGRGRADGGI